MGKPLSNAHKSEHEIKRKYKIKVDTSFVVWPSFGVGALLKLIYLAEL